MSLAKKTLLHIGLSLMISGSLFSSEDIEIIKRNNIIAPLSATMKGHNNIKLLYCSHNEQIYYLLVLNEFNYDDSFNIELELSKLEEIVELKQNDRIVVKQLHNAIEEYLSNGPKPAKR